MSRRLAAAALRRLCAACARPRCGFRQRDAAPAHRACLYLRRLCRAFTASTATHMRRGPLHRLLLLPRCTRKTAEQRGMAHAPRIARRRAAAPHVCRRLRARAASRPSTMLAPWSLSPIRPSSHCWCSASNAVSIHCVPLVYTKGLFPLILPLTRRLNWTAAPHHFSAVGRSITVHLFIVAKGRFHYLCQQARYRAHRTASAHASSFSVMTRLISCEAEPADSRSGWQARPTASRTFRQTMRPMRAVAPSPLTTTDTSSPLA
jgi:hypothetical protein